MKPWSNSHETLPFNGSTPHILQTLGRIEGKQEAQGEHLREMRADLKSIDVRVTKIQARPPWWESDRLWWLLAIVAVLLLAPSEVQERLFKLLMK